MSSDERPGRNQRTVYVPPDLQEKVEHWASQQPAKPSFSSAMQHLARVGLDVGAVRLPDSYRPKVEDLRRALGADSAPQALMRLLDAPPRYLAECLSRLPSLTPVNPTQETADATAAE
jgi:hypothetical protein